MRDRLENFQNMADHHKERMRIIVLLIAAPFMLALLVLSFKTDLKSTQIVSFEEKSDNQKLFATLKGGIAEFMDDISANDGSLSNQVGQVRNAVFPNVYPDRMESFAEKDAQNGAPKLPEENIIYITAGN